MNVSLVNTECCQVEASVKVPIPHPEKSYRVCVCVFLSVTTRHSDLYTYNE